MIATLTPDHRFLNLAVVNATDREQKFDLSVNGIKIVGASKLWQLTGNSLDAVNRVGQPAQAEVKEIPMNVVPGTIMVAPTSVNIYQFPVAGAQ